MFESDAAISGLRSRYFVDYVFARRVQKRVEEVNNIFAFRSYVRKLVAIINEENHHKGCIC